MQKVDHKRELKQLYNTSSRDISIIDVPVLPFLMIDGVGNPNTSTFYKQAVEALFGLSYTLKFMVKKGASAIDYTVMPLEGLWWVDDMRQFDVNNKDDWKWTAMIMQPDFITLDMFKTAREQLSKKKSLPALEQLRFENFQEGQTAQIMYFGAYVDEAPTIARLHAFIEAQGHKLSGKHHEIYISDPARTAPEKLKTIIRQPYT